jgi:hypothetical protein
MAGATITFGADTLGDDANGKTVAFGNIGAECVVQQEALAGGANPFLAPRGNVGGEFSFLVTTSYATLDLMIAALKTELARVNTQASLVLTRGVTTMTMANAICRAAARHSASEGVKLVIAYTFQHKGIS